MPNVASSRLSVFLAVACMALSAPAWAQKDAGSIVGTVKDQTGAIVAKAKVTVSDVERGTYLESATNDSASTWPARSVWAITRSRWSTPDSKRR